VEVTTECPNKYKVTYLPAEHSQANKIYQIKLDEGCTAMAKDKAGKYSTKVNEINANV